MPLVIFEDDHLLVVNKPAGLNTHAPAPFAGEGLYDWLRRREARWGTLAIIHRLDKETSGVMVFSKSALANRSLTEQFAKRAIQKRYLFLTDRLTPVRELAVRTALVRAGERYLSRPTHVGAEVAETRFRSLGPPGRDAVPGVPVLGRKITDTEDGIPTGCMRRPGGFENEFQKPLTLVEAEPLTGRTHQIRVHAADAGFPVLGDTLYGGTPAPRVYLHAAALRFKHPVTGKEVSFQAPADFGSDPRQGLRHRLIDSAQSNAFRLIHGASDGWPGWYVDKLGEYLLSQSSETLSAEQKQKLEQLMENLTARGAYHKVLSRQVRKLETLEASPRPVLGVAAPAHFEVLENGLNFELSFSEGYSVGLFLDQRDNRRRLLTSHVAAGFPLLEPNSRAETPQVLNAFAYTCGFSVCVAKAGSRVTSLDLSRKYLDWGRRNFLLNGLNPADHDFIYGDVFDWLRRLAKKGRRFELVLLDPPTFSQSRNSGVWRARRDYGKLICAAVSLLAPRGVLFASSNEADWPPEEFMTTLEHALEKSHRRVASLHYVPQPPDFPISRAEPAYLKTAWVRVKEA